jgi:hypothetical protein
MNRTAFRADRKVGMWNPIFFEPVVAMVRYLIGLFW